jgi:beta-lactamase class A
VAVAWYDYETRKAWDLDGDEWFHAASTIKVPILLGVFGAAHRGVLVLDSRVHVRNRFYSAADGEPFRVESGRDANSEVHRHLGKTMKVNELAYHMIVTSASPSASWGSRGWTSSAAWKTSARGGSSSTTGSRPRG